MDFQINIPTDNDGFYSLECPHCNERFKAQAGDVDSEKVIELFCPNCGLSSERSNFIPKAVIEHAEVLAANYLQEEIFKALGKTSRKMKGSNVSMRVNKPREEVPEMLKEDDNLEPFRLECCDKNIKISLSQIGTVVYCPYCGQN